MTMRCLISHKKRHWEAIFMAFLIGPVASAVGETPEARERIQKRIEACETLPNYKNYSKWDPYNPMEGHPTPIEKRAFIDKLRQTASDGQRMYGVPDVGLLAMAAQEGGYGFTRTGYCAGNILGFKYGGAATKDGLVRYSLPGQPASDPGNVYPAFDTHEASLGFGSRQLGTAFRYAPATKAAKEATASGMPQRQVILAWLEGIRNAGYNPTCSYPEEVMKTGESNSLFSGPPLSKPPKPDANDTKVALAQLQAKAVGRYMVEGAQCTKEKSSDWGGTREDGIFQRCRYSVTSCSLLKTKQKDECEAYRKVTEPKTATAVLLEPGLQRFAEWIASACAVAGGDRAKCITRLVADGDAAGNWQIPMAGIVFEDMEHNHYVHFGYAFRSGLTVRADADCGWKNGSPNGEASPSPKQDVACSTASPSREPAAVSFQARPVLTTLSEVRAYKPELLWGVRSHKEGEMVDGDARDSWLKFVQCTLISSSSSSSNLLVTAKAVALRKRGAF